MPYQIRGLWITRRNQVWSTRSTPTRYTPRSQPYPNEIIGSEEKNNYLSNLKLCSICWDLPSEGSALHKECTKERGAIKPFLFYKIFTYET